MIIWWKGLWYDLKRKLARYHPQTRERTINGNREFWDDNYRGWRRYEAERLKPKDERMTLFPDGQVPPEVEK